MMMTSPPLRQFARENDQAAGTGVNCLTPTFLRQAQGHSWQIRLRHATALCQLAK